MNFKQLSEESKFIKKVALGFIILSSIASLFFIFNLGRILYLSFNSTPLNSFPINIKINIIGYYLFNYFGIISTLCALITLFSLASSIKLYLLKNRILFVYALILNIILIIICNAFIYSFLELGHESSSAIFRDKDYNNFWYIEIYPIGFISILFVICFIYLIVKLSTKKIKQDFAKNNA